MKPTYSQSATAETHDMNLATKGRQVEAWLASLPDSAPIAQAALLADYLLAHDRADLSADFRNQLLDLTGPSVSQALRVLEAEFRDARLPLAAGQQDSVDEAIRLLLAVAGLYKRLIVEHAENSPRLFGGNALPGYVSGFLKVAGRMLDICYQCHGQVPEGLWLDIHQTGYLVFQAGLAMVSDPARSASTLAEIYTGLLLESVADPYHYSAQERIWVRDLIARVGRLARVESAQTTGFKGVYGIRVAQDEPPYPLAMQVKNARDCELVLHTAILVKKLALVLGYMEQGRILELDIPLVRHPAYKAVLHRLKMAWGGSSLRTSTRRAPLQPVQYRMMLGFYTIHSYLAGGSAEAMESAIFACRLVNESHSGVAVSVEKPAFQLKIGLLALVGTEQGLHDVGVVRWFKTSAEGSLTIGIIYHLQKPKPVTVFTGDGRHVYPGLLPGQKKQPGVAASASIPIKLILPAVRMGNSTRVEVRQDRKKFHVQLTERLEGSTDLVLYRANLDPSVGQI
jgi:hypothetical protein